MPIDIILDIPNSFLKEAKYTVENILYPFNEKFVVVDKTLSLEGNVRKIIYCTENSVHLNSAQNNKNNLYVILEDSSLVFFSRFQTYDSKEILYIKNVPCLFPLKQKRIDIGRNVLSFDIFAASFFFLSCWQEYSVSDRDKKGRIPLKKTLQYDLDIIRLPIVNEYLRILEGYMERLWGDRIPSKSLPGGGTYVALSHDICRVDLPFKEYFKHSLRNRRSIEMNFSNLIDMAKNTWSKKKYFKIIKDIERKHGAVSSFFFLSDYPTEHRLFVDGAINSLEESGFGIGHHISDKSVFAKELGSDKARFENFNSAFIGERVHTLRFDVHSLFLQLEENSYDYDNSLLFAENLGYRTGFSYPHYLFDPVNKKTFNTLALPLNIMDGTLVDGKYLGLDDGNAEQELFQFVDNNINYGGVLSILFHLNFFWINSKRRVAIYERLLNYFNERNIKVGTCEEIYYWHKDARSIY